MSCLFVLWTLFSFKMQFFVLEVSQELGCCPPPEKVVVLD